MENLPHDQPPGICGTCRETLVTPLVIKPAPKTGNRDGEFNATRMSVSLDEAKACAFCWFFWVQECKRIPMSRDSHPLSFEIRWGRRLLEVAVMELNFFETSFRRGGYMIYTDYDSPLRHYIPGRWHTSKEDLLGISRDWVSECDSDHGAQCCSMTAPHLPTRVVDVDADNDSKLSLVEGLGRTGRYMALSHSWGGNTKGLTTTDNVQSRYSEIPLNELPHSFADAIEVTRAFGVRYLWIDSLCIIQNDESDWRSEAASMGEVYQHSYLTIAAGDTSSDAASFLTDNNSDAAVLTVPLNDGGSRFKLRLRTEKDDYNITNSPLNKRAWVLQERVLSPRILTFSRTGAHFECLQHYRAENGLHIVLHREVGRVLDLFRFNLSSRTSLLLQGLHRYDSSMVQDKIMVWEFWQGLMRRYSHTNLTFAKDRVIAILGIMNRMKEATGIGFLAGHWIASPKLFMISLLWTDKYPLREPTLPRAPSWSFLALDGPKICHSVFGQPHHEDAVLMVHYRAYELVSEINILLFLTGVLAAHRSELIAFESPDIPGNHNTTSSFLCPIVHAPYSGIDYGPVRPLCPYCLILKHTGEEHNSLGVYRRIGWAVAKSYQAITEDFPRTDFVLA